MRNSIKILGVCLLIAQIGIARPYESIPKHYNTNLEETGLVKGTVLDANGLPIAYASVELFQGKTLIDGTLSHGDGSFILTNLELGEYTLKITGAGMLPYVHGIKIDSENKDIGEIILNNDSIELQDITVRAETSKITTQIDKRVIDVGKDLVSAGASASDVLNNIPSLSVDQQSGELALRGNSNVRVFVDGKPSSIPASELLKQIPSNAISKVEIITNPSAKYSPEGNSGIINIITIKEKRKGYNVGLNAGFSHGKKNRYNGSINTNWNTGKLNLFANYSAKTGERKFIGSFDNRTTGYFQDINVESENTNHRIKAGFDWFINDKSALTIYTNQSYSIGDADINSDLSIAQNNSFFQDRSLSDDKSNSRDYSLNYKLDFEKEGHSIEFDGFASIYDKDEESNFDWESTSINVNNPTLADDLRVFVQDEDLKVTNTRIKLDYTFPFLEKGLLEAGLFYEQEGTENTLSTNQKMPVYTSGFGVTSSYEAQNTYFDFNRDVYATYVNLKYQFGKLGAQVGIRGEQVELDAITSLYGSADIKDVDSKFDRENPNYYPSVFLTYKATEADEFSLNYSRRVDRPGVWSLSPIRQWQTATTRQEGNPNLKPQFTDSYELGYMHTFGRKGSINAAAYYRKIHDEMAQFVSLDEVNPSITVLRRDNIDDNASYGAEVSWFYKATPWWSFNGGLDVYTSTLKSTFSTTNENLEVDVTTFSGRFSNDFTLTPTLNLQLFTMYKAPEDNLQGKMESMFRQDIGLRKTFLDKKLNFTARYSDIFNTFYAKMNMVNPQDQVGEFHWESQVFYLGISYNFGGKVKTRANKQRNESDSGNQGGIGM